ncbi:hypothetical protein AMBLS11_12305 [Alteromonas macleodii str. 'Black Sea 11']|nr:hypothetical protein AMBLS11_12305 [Alteromonas macleodii str. 'Black Sea 11']
MFQFFPDITPSKSGFYIQPANSISYNPISKVEHVSRLPGEKWKATLNWTFLKKAEAITVRAFLNQHINHGRFYLRDTAHQNRSNWNGVLVNGANQYGTLLTVDGAQPNSVFYAGDRFTLDGFMYELTADKVASPTGILSLQFMPELRRIPTDNTALEGNSPYGTFMLENTKQIPSFSGNRRGVKNTTINFIEALRP